MGVKQEFADSRKVQQGDGSFITTIPIAIAEEFGIEEGDEVVWKCSEGDDVAELLRPRGSDG